jgi:hypothetical protein
MNNNFDFKKYIENIKFEEWFYGKSEPKLVDVSPQSFNLRDIIIIVK